MKVANELQEVVQQQQRELDAAALRSQSGTKAPLTQTAGPSPPSVSPHIAQLQSLVQTVRAELDRPRSSGSTGSQGPGHAAPPDSDAARLQSEIHALKQQITQLQQHEQTQRRSARTEAHREASANVESIRAALLDAEMELQKATSEAASLRVKVAEGESAKKAQERELAATQAELQAAVVRADAAEALAAEANSHRDEAMRRANAAAAEVGKLQASCSQKDAAMQAAKQAAERASTHLAEAEAKAAAAEAAAAIEQSKRGSLEATVARLQSEILSLEGELAEATRRGKAEVHAFAAQSEALQEELLAAQREARVAKRQAEAAQDQIDSLHQAHAVAVASAKALQEKSLGLETEREAAERRAAHAEAKAAAATAAAAQQDAAAELKARHENEIKALKEVLDRVAAAAQQKDAAMHCAQAELAAAVASFGQERAALQAAAAEAEQRLLATQVAAAAEAKQWAAHIEEARQAAARAEPPLKLQISVQEPREWQEGDPIPSALQRWADKRVETIRDHLQRDLDAAQEALRTERREHMAAVHDLEEAHTAAVHALQARHAEELEHAIDEAAAAAMAEVAAAEGQASPEPKWLGATAVRRGLEAAEAEAGALREEITILTTRGAEAQARLRAAETELLAAQDNAARLNSAVGKLQARCTKYKEELAATKAELAQANEAARSAAQRAESAEAEKAAAHAELADAQDEVEALLTARLETLSRAPSEADPCEPPLASAGGEYHLEGLEGLPRGDPFDAYYDEPQVEIAERAAESLPLDGPLGMGSMSFSGTGRIESFSSQGRLRAHVVASYPDASAVSTPRDEVPDPMFEKPARKSPLKKLAALLRGKKARQPALPKSEPAAAVVSGPVSRTLRRGEDGSVHWMPNGVASQRHEGSLHGGRMQQASGNGKWRENDLYVEHSAGDLEY